MPSSALLSYTPLTHRARSKKLVLLSKTDAPQTAAPPPQLSYATYEMVLQSKRLFKIHLGLWLGKDLFKVKIQLGLLKPLGLLGCSKLLKWSYPPNTEYKPHGKGSWGPSITYSMYTVLHSNHHHENDIYLGVQVSNIYSPPNFINLGRVHIAHNGGLGKVSNGCNIMVQCCCRYSSQCAEGNTKLKTEKCLGFGSLFTL